MASRTFYWHDYETFGLNAFHDRPAQFAGQRTTAELEPIGEADSWFCRMTPEALPDPGAVLVTGITPQETVEKGLVEEEFARLIEERFTVPETVSVGYNSYSFDDTVTRALFWRTLRDPYAREFKDGCSRWDLYPFVLAVWALRPEGIEWPQIESPDHPGEKRQTFRLEHLAKANHLLQDRPHAADSDVTATIELARLLRARQPRLWNYALEHTSKAQVIRMLQSGAPVLWVDPMAGQERGFLRFVRPIDPKFDKGNEVWAWDCRENPDEACDLDADTLALRLYGSREELEKRGLTRLRGLVTLRVNQSPFVCADLRVAGPSVRERFAIDLAEIELNAQRFEAARDKLKNLVLTLTERSAAFRSEKGPSDPEAGLYQGGFPSREDVARRNRVARLMKENPAELCRRAFEEGMGFDDARYAELLRRHCARSLSPYLTEAGLAWRAEWTRARLLEGKAGGRTLEAYRHTLETLQSSAQTPEAQELLAALARWGDACEEAMRQG